MNLHVFSKASDRSGWEVGGWLPLERLLREAALWKGTILAYLNINSKNEKGGLLCRHISQTKTCKRSILGCADRREQ